jgi:hypothetical protein
MIAELEKEQERTNAVRIETTLSLQARIQEVDRKIQRLMDAYLDPGKALSLEEFKPAKADLVRQKQQARDELAAFEASHETWLEPAIRFVKDSKRAGILAREGTNEEKRDFFKKNGSNRKISDRHLSAEPREAWKLVVDQGHFAQHNTAPDISGAAFVGETDPVLEQAERAGFEPAKGFKPLTAFPVLLLRPLGHLSKMRRHSRARGGYPPIFGGNAEC